MKKISYNLKEIFQANVFRSQADIIPSKVPWSALLLIPAIIVSGAYWTSIPFYLVIATLWLFQRKTPIPWEAGIALMGSCLLAIFIVDKTDYAFWIYTIKIVGCFVIVVSLRPAIQNQQRFWIDTFFVFVLWIIWETNSYFHLGRWTFDFGGRYHPNWTAVYCFLFAMLAVRWRLPLALLTALTLGWLTGSRNFSLALGMVGMGYLLFPIWRWVFSKTSRTVVLYLFLAGLSLWILEQITNGQWTEVHLFNERIFRFSADPGRLDWDMMGIKEWTKNMQTFAWGIGDWPNDGPNPHHSLIHTLLERGIIGTTVLIIFIMGDLSKHARGMEPWLLGWFSLGMYLHLNFVTMFWVITMLVLRCRYVRNGEDDVQEDALVEWLLKKWKIFRLRLASS
ncbi:MAG: hypothetical protein HOC18_01510 [Candidatus Marinimicrobia bacterium]|jgi:hypothetical protein|nr:hypothetical protein [Candidatus Neomarinimicrobiota bacterium]